MLWFGYYIIFDVSTQWCTRVCGTSEAWCRQIKLRSSVEVWVRYYASLVQDTVEAWCRKIMTTKI